MIFPVQPSEDDLTAAPVTVQNLKGSGAPFVFVLTRVKPHTLITAQAAAILSKHGQVAETFVADRTGYKSPYAKGQTITEAEPKGAAARKLLSLWENIKSCLHESMQNPDGGEEAWLKRLSCPKKPWPRPVQQPRAAQPARAPAPSAPAPAPKAAKPPKAPQVPLQIRIPAREAKAIKRAALEADQTISEFMLACFHARMKK